MPLFPEPSAVEQLTDQAYWHLILGAEGKTAARRQVLELCRQLARLFDDCFDEPLAGDDHVLMAAAKELRRHLSDEEYWDSYAKRNWSGPGAPTLQAPRVRLQVETLEAMAVVVSSVHA